MPEASSRSAAVELPLDLLEAEQIGDFLSEFIKHAWPLIEPEPLVWGWHLDAICEHLEAVTRGEISKLLINVPPRHMKSLATSVFWPAWEWLRRPELRYLTVSYSADLASRDAGMARQLMRTTDAREGLFSSDSTLLQRIGYRGILRLLGNEWDFEDDQNTRDRYRNDRSGYRIATSIGGGSTGEGGDRLIVDDPHKLEEWNSKKKLAEAAEFVSEIVPSRLGPNSAVVMIMQRVHERDAAAVVRGEVDDRTGWGDELEHLALPEQFEPNHPFRWPADPRTEEGELLWPERFSLRTVEARKATMASMRYAGHYQQRPSASEGNFFKREDWRYYGLGGEKLQLPHAWQFVVCSWDPTFGLSEDPDGSWPVGQCWGIDGADVYLLFQIRTKMTFNEQKQAIRDLAAARPAGVGCMTLIEETASGRPLIESLKSEIGGIKGIIPRQGKQARAIAAQAAQEAGNLWLPKQSIPAPHGYESTPTEVFVDEAANFPAGTADQVDAMSQALTDLLERGPSWSAICTSTIPEEGGPLVRAGGRLRRGDRYVDKPPPESRS